jgi:hypothetical protein
LYLNHHLLYNEEWVIKYDEIIGKKISGTEKAVLLDSIFATVSSEATPSKENKTVNKDVVDVQLTKSQIAALQAIIDLIAPPAKQELVLNYPDYQTSHYNKLFQCPIYFLETPITLFKASCCCNLPVIHYHGNHILLHSKFRLEFLNSVIFLSLNAVALFFLFEPILELSRPEFLEILKGTEIIPLNYGMLPICYGLWICQYFIYNSNSIRNSVLFGSETKPHFPIVGGWNTPLFNKKKQLLCLICKLPITDGNVHYNVALFDTFLNYAAFIKVGSQNILLKNSLLDEKTQFLYKVLRDIIESKYLF